MKKLFRKRRPVFQLMVYKSDEDVTDLQVMGFKDVAPYVVKSHSTLCAHEVVQILAHALAKAAATSHLDDVPSIRGVCQAPAQLIHEISMTSAAEEGECS